VYYINVRLSVAFLAIILNVVALQASLLNTSSSLAAAPGVTESITIIANYYELGHTV
jgi:hypothetical protein